MKDEKKEEEIDPNDKFNKILKNGSDKKDLGN